jgi:hypothetical protein
MKYCHDLILFTYSEIIIVTLSDVPKNEFVGNMLIQ